MSSGTLEKYAAIMRTSAASSTSYFPPSLTRLGSVSTLTMNASMGSRRDDMDNDCLSEMSSGDRNRTSGGTNPFCGMSFP